MILAMVLSVLVSSVHIPIEKAVTIEKNTLQQKEDWYDIKVEYPIMTSNEYGTYASQMNTMFHNKAKEHMEGSIQHAEVYRYLAQKRDAPLQYQYTYDITYNEKPLVSILYTHYELSSGPKDFSYHYAKTFHMQEGKELKLDDFFVPSSTFRTFLTKYVKSELNKQTDTVYFEQLESRPKFYLDKNDLVLFALPGDYVPPEEHAPHIRIPYEQLRPYLKEQYKSIFLSSMY
ncbi:DUF3298 domain-containing protein [Pontibacillus litoralis]|uniref:DUF3298 domain-containing protein n=1 Tax=Pontibacillus litoralis JSM 072002 TaxID=1385512 RepID=A0A0A5G3A1_9BACI|nr:DUF3298 domain-containing protein [Pontibacillus litoralis]KGX85550.1 hypothetical protein N784_08560 [Pontibacillus litoralis JSM 072002]